MPFMKLPRKFVVTSTARSTVEGDICVALTSEGGEFTFNASVFQMPSQLNLGDIVEIKFEKSEWQIEQKQQ